VPESGSRDLMASRRHLSVIVRVVVGPGGRLVNGSLVDMDQRPRGRFADWAGLTDRLRRWVEETMSDGRERPPRE
jgi:hypothetical protein